MNAWRWLRSRFSAWPPWRQRKRPLREIVEADGYEFRARLDVDVPLAVLEMHARRASAPPPQTPPTLPTLPTLPTPIDPRDGHWEPVLRVLRVGGYQRDELPPVRPIEPYTSPVGVVPRDGGDYLEFLKAVRRRVEATPGAPGAKGAMGTTGATGATARAELEEALRRLCAEPRNAPFVARLGGPDAVLERCLRRPDG